MEGKERRKSEGGEGDAIRLQIARFDEAWHDPATESENYEDAEAVDSN